LSTHCVLKHLSQILVLLPEYVKGNEDSFHKIIGHLGEAEDHLCTTNVVLMREIREHRLAFMEENGGYTIPIVDLLAKL